MGIAVVQGPEALPDGRNNDGDGEIDEFGERAGMSGFVLMINAGPPGIGFPQVSEQYYNVMQGQWSGDIPITERWIGYQSDGDTLAFHFPGDPARGEFWSEVNLDGRGRRDHPGRRSFALSTGPFRMEPGETEEVVFAIVYAQGSSNLAPVTVLRAATDEVRFLYEQSAFVPRRVTPDEGSDDEDPVAPDLPPDYRFAAYPNPVADALTVRYALPAAQHVRLVLYDVLGREVARLVDRAVEPGEYTVERAMSGLPSGLYLLRAEFGSDFLAVTRRLVVLRLR